MLIDLLGAKLVGEELSVDGDGGGGGFWIDASNEFHVSEGLNHSWVVGGIDFFFEDLVGDSAVHGA